MAEENGPVGLSKQEIKECLAGAPTSVVPARLFWMDEKFVEANRDEVERIRAVNADDFVQTGVLLKKRAREPVLEPGEFTDDWGCLFAGAPHGVGAHPTRPIIRNVDEWEHYRVEGMPVIEPEAFARGVRDAVAAHSDRYVVAAFWRTFYERMYMLAGFENLMVEIATEGDLFMRMLPVLRDFTLEGIDRIADAGADAVFLADDWGTQRGLQISPDSWRKHFKPAYGAMIDAARARGLEVWFHSCGNITEIIPEWIDLGLDVLAHLQSAALDLPAIAATYRGRLTFFGGIDVQFNLVKGTGESIRDEVRALINDFHAFDGRFIISPSNSIMPETPVENVWTLFRAIRELGIRSGR